MGYLITCAQTRDKPRVCWCTAAFAFTNALTAYARRLLYWVYMSRLNRGTLSYANNACQPVWMRLFVSVFVCSHLWTCSSRNESESAPLSTCIYNATHGMCDMVPTNSTTYWYRTLEHTHNTTNTTPEPAFVNYNRMSDVCTRVIHGRLAFREVLASCYTV